MKSLNCFTHEKAQAPWGDRLVGLGSRGQPEPRASLLTSTRHQASQGGRVGDQAGEGHLRTPVPGSGPAPLCNSGGRKGEDRNPRVGGTAAKQEDGQELPSPSVRSGHSEWLFSCPLSIPCLTRARFTYTYSQDRPAYILAPGPSW